MAPGLFGGICEKHYAVKLMLKELSGREKMRGEEQKRAVMVVCTDISLRKATAEGSSFGLDAPTRPIIPRTSLLTNPHNPSSLFPTRHAYKMHDML